MQKTILTLALASATLGAGAQQLAFPGAEGYGAYATGGRGGQVVHVTNLNAAGSGSLADAVSQPGRFVVFDVGGVIDITGKSITIASNVTIAGQTAPGEGITIYGGRVIASKAKNVIMRYIRMRGGKSVNSSKCTLTLDECQNLIMDHCSVSWGPWDNVHIKDANNITWQHSIISEGIEPQRFGSITDGTRNWTIHHCLWADNKSRNPKMKCYLQYYNNVVYNYAMGIIGGHSAADNYQDVINNYFIAGPEGSAKYFDDWTATDHLYSSGNYFDGNRDGQLNGTLITDHHNATPMAAPNFQTTHPMNVETAAEAYRTVADQVGASRVRDIHDKRILEHLTSLGTKGSFIANEDNVGGIGTVAGGPRPTDSDNDGMPDDWERANGLNASQNDANAYTLGGGYTNIEHYVNSLAAKSAFLYAPANPVATLQGQTSVKLTWELNEREGVTGIVVEQSSDGTTFAAVQQLAANASQTTISGLTAGAVYYFRVKAVGTGNAASAYSPVVSVNNEYMRAGGGTPGGTTTFAPATGKVYRIISYATVPYNSGTTLNGTPKYLTFNANGTLGTTEQFQWDDPSLLWVITPVSGGVTIRNYSSKQYINGRNASIDGADRIGTSDTPFTLTINYTGDQKPSQSGIFSAVSMYRINSPSASNQQIRARGFGDDWFWGSGTYDRADMVFTFVEVDVSHVQVFLKTFNATLQNARQLANGAQTDVTLGYPTAALTALMDAITSAQAFANNINEQTQQDDIDAQVAALNAAMTQFESTRIYTLEGFSTDMAYCIFSYGTHPNASAANADANTERRYLYATTSADGQRDSLVYRIGLTENAIKGGATDPLASDPAALWALHDEGNGFVRARNLKTNSYLQVESYLSPTRAGVRPYYAKHDNGHMAFFIDSSASGRRLLNVGAPDGNGGPVEFFGAHADRVRLRWVFLPTDVEVTFPTAMTPTTAAPTTPPRYYDLRGMQLTRPPHTGLYIVTQDTPQGTVSHKVSAHSTSQQHM